MPKRNVGTWSSRPHDYLYDPCCILSSAKDHAKEASRAIHNSCDLAFLPIYRRMFSELPNHPPGVMHLQDRKPIPWFIARKYRKIGSGVQETQSNQSTLEEVTGPELFKFFRRPQVCDTISEEIAAMLYHLDYSVLNPSPRDVSNECPLENLVCDVWTQTDFRDSATQTDPYTPHYRLLESTQPEILTLATLAWKNGLPAGEKEIIMIERARIKKRLEASLPKMSPENFDERTKLISKIEWGEWKFREEQIQELNDIKMVLTRQLLKKENERFTKESAIKLKRMWEQREADREELVKRLNKFKFRETVKLNEKQKAFKLKLSKKNKVDQHLDPGSELFVPLLRNGRNSIRCGQTQISQCTYLKTYRDIVELENFISEKRFNPSFTQPILPRLPEEGYIKRKYKNSKQLDDAYKTMLSERGLSPIQKTFTGTMALMEKLEKPPPRPQTPEVKGPSVMSQRIDESVTFIQKLLRGRVVQILMHDGKERCNDLIEELRTSHALYVDQQEKLDQIRVALKTKTEEKVKLDKKEMELEAVVESLVGERVAQMLDFLSKELIRLQDERQIHALAIFAERQRRIREAEESGLRQTEERRRREEEEIFRNILTIHQKSSDLYLQEIILESIHRTVSQQAAYEVQAMADRINRTAKELDERNNQIQSEEMVAELVHSFLIPEVERMKVRENVRRKQQAALIAVHEFIYTDAIADRQQPSESSYPEPEQSTSTDDRRASQERQTLITKARSKKLSTVVDDFHSTNGLEEGDVYLPGQMKYYQLRGLIDYEELYYDFGDEISPLATSRRHSLRTGRGTASRISVSKSSKKK